MNIIRRRSTALGAFMGIRGISLLYIMTVFMAGSAFAGPFGSVVVTNGLSYSRIRDYHYLGRAFPNSRLGMNKFSECMISNDEIAETVSELVRFLKYVLPRRMANGGEGAKEVWNQRGFERMRSIDLFPGLPDHETRFRGKVLKTLRVVVFPFKVGNRLSEEELEMVLLKIYFGDEFQGACYYNSSTSDISTSFIGASGNENLVGHESFAPYLTGDELSAQGKLCREIQNAIRPSNRRSTRSTTLGESAATNEIEVMDMGL